MGQRYLPNHFWYEFKNLIKIGVNNINAIAVSTGKHINQGGIRGRTESTGLGVYYGIRELLNTDTFCKKAGLSKGIKNKTFVVQVRTLS
jgi:glutamate dehydrogenase/leucine dehydrogenase